MIIDLCCGKGRFESQNEEIISIDINRKVKPTIIADVRFLPLKPSLKPRLCHASPPCKYLSIARARFGLHEEGIAESLRIVAACFDAFVYLKARTWTLENPKGYLRKFVPTDIEIEYAAHDLMHKATNFWSNNRALKRAIIPQDIRQKILSIAKESEQNE
jgi:site-specific DNA-cytosine methylase